MKNLITSLGMLLCFFVSAQTTNVAYTASSTVFSNPERGFYKFTSAKSTDYQLLNQTTLNDYRINQNITLIYRDFRIGLFVNSPISSTYLANMQSDFDKIRNAGLKCIIRFTYSNSESTTPRDATKAMILSHLAQLQPILQANTDVIMLMQAGFIGVWGEWYYTSQAEFGGYGYDSTSLTTTNINNRKDVINAMLNALPSNRMIQVRTPAFKQKMFTTAALTDSQSFTETNLARVGHFNDCFLASSDDYGTYVNPTVEFPYLTQETKFLPMGGETCALNSPRSDCASAIFEMNRFHWSFLNLDYSGPVIDNFLEDNCFTDVQKRLGYRFQLNTAVLPQNVTTSSTLPVTLKITNLGFAAPFNERNAYIILKNTLTNQVFSLLMNTDPRTWLGPNELTITENLSLPSNLPSGSYRMYLSLPDATSSISARPDYAIRFANESVWESTTGYNNLNHTVNVNAPLLGVANNSKLSMTIYPVPANNELAIEMEGISDFKVTVYNSLGQNVNASNTIEINKMTISTQNLSNGLYFVEFSKEGIKEIRKIIVRH